MDKDKKKTLTISSNLTKKIDTLSISSGSKKSFSINKKKRVGLINNLINRVHLLTFLLIKIIRKKIL